MTATVLKHNFPQNPSRHTASSVQSVLVPLDGTEASKAALPVARTVSQFYAATLHLAYVGEGDRNMNELVSQLGLTAEEVRGTVLHQRRGLPEQTVNELASELDDMLIVISTQVGEPFSEERFGAVTEAIFQANPERIVLLNQGSVAETWRLRQILLAHDGTPASDAATFPAAELAQAAGAEVLALHVAARGKNPSSQPGSIPAPQYVDQLQHEWPSWTQEFMNRMLAAGAPPSSVHFQLVVTGGQAGSEVAEVARERGVDLVVMAWHGHTNHKTCATRVVIRNAGCPVLLVFSQNGMHPGAADE